MSQSDAPNCGPDAVERHRELPAWSRASGWDRLSGYHSKVEPCSVLDASRCGAGKLWSWSSDERPEPQALAIVRRVPEPCPELGGGPGGCRQRGGPGPGQRKEQWRRWGQSIQRGRRGPGMGNVWEARSFQKEEQLAVLSVSEGSKKIETQMLLSLAGMLMAEWCGHGGCRLWPGELGGKRSDP